MRILIPIPLTGLPRIAELLGERHEIVQAAGDSEADLLEAVPGVDALVATGMDVSAEVIRAGTRLQVIGTPQVGSDRIDVAAASRAGVPVLSSQGLAAVSVAEFAVGLMLDLTRRIGRADRALRSADGWRSRRTFTEPDALLAHELRGSTVGIAGLGLIGAETARILGTAFGCRVLGFDPVVTAEAMQQRGVEKVDRMVDLARRSDFLVLHVPLIDATRHLVDAEVLAAMRPTAFVLNVSRGGVLDDDAFAAAIRDGRIAGGALDVFESEPLPADSPLLAFDNVILTPHIGGVTHEWNATRSAAFAERVQQVFDGVQPTGLADPGVWPAFERRRAELGR